MPGWRSGLPVVRVRLRRPPAERRRPPRRDFVSVVRGCSWRWERAVRWVSWVAVGGERAPVDIFGRWFGGGLDCGVVWNVVGGMLGLAAVYERGVVGYV